MPTARNAKGVDIIIYNADASKYRGIQVKTLSARVDVPLGSSVSNILGDFWAILNDVAKTPKVFILTPQQVRDGAVENQKDGRSSFWLNRRYYEQEAFVDAWEQIGLGHPLSETPLASEGE